jgi:glucokinase
MPVNFPFPALVCDIGGTNVRFAVASRAGAPLSQVLHKKTDAYPSLEAAAAEVIPCFAEKPRSMIVCAAGLVEGKEAKLTNAAWMIDGVAVAARLGLEQGLLLNDFEAQALSLPTLPAGSFEVIGPGCKMGAGTQVILGPGTGLGVAALIEAEGKFLALPSEGGHIDFGPASAEEAAIWAHLDRSSLGRISAELILSGPGLVRLHHACLASKGEIAADLDSPTIVQHALARPDGEEARTIGLFWRLIARFASDMAVTFKANGGITFSGGILPRIRTLLDPAVFRAQFENKAPFHAFTQSMGTRLIVTEDGVLVGMAAIAADPNRYAIDYAGRAWRHYAALEAGSNVSTE